MKNFKVISLIVALIMALSVFSFSVFAEETSATEPTNVTDPTDPTGPTDPTDPTDPTEPEDPDAPVTSGDWVYRKITATTIEIIEYKGTSAKCVVPGTLDEKTVVSLASGVVKNNAEITEITIPGTLTSFSADSFMGCINLKTITLESGKLQSFDVEFCQSLETVNLPETVKAVGRFEYCSSLQNINIAAKNATLKSVNGVVYSKDGKTLVKYPAGKLANRFVIPQTVTTVADYAFSETKGNIKEIYAYSTVVKMGDNAFYGCTSKILFQADKIPAGCANAVKGKQTDVNQINIYAPTKVASSEKATELTLSWEKVTGADGYAVYYRSGNSWKHYKNLVANQITIKNLKVGTRYTFAIRSIVKVAGNKLVGSPNYITYATSTLPVATSKIASAKNDVAIKIAWTKVTGADGYAIYHKTAKGWQHLANTTALTVTFKNLKPYTDYTFAVRTLIKTANKLVAGSYRTITVKTNLGVPVVSATQKQSGTVNLTWSAGIGSSHYQVFYKVNNGDWVLAGTYNKVTTVPFKAAKGLKVSFAVRGVRVESGKVVAKSDYKPITVTVK